LDKLTMSGPGHRTDFSYQQWLAGKEYIRKNAALPEPVEGRPIAETLGN